VTEARAAVTGHKVRYVLAFSLLGMSRPSSSSIFCFLAKRFALHNRRVPAEKRDSQKALARLHSLHVDRAFA
jgi:hypothetical protein